MESTISIIISGLTLIALIWSFRDRASKSGKDEQKIHDDISNLQQENSNLRNNITTINKDIKDIKENHLYHIEKYINGININIAEIKTSLQFLKEKE